MRFDSNFRTGYLGSISLEYCFQLCRIKPATYQLQPVSRPLGQVATSDLLFQSRNIPVCVWLFTVWGSCFFLPEPEKCLLSKCSDNKWAVAFKDHVEVRASTKLWETWVLGFSWSSMLKEPICYLLDWSGWECFPCSWVKWQQRGLRQVHVGSSTKDRQRLSGDKS